ncbi:MAG: 2,3-bisphosphoglycerate-independent phosphoglycerate mutase [Candidatus Pacebacteria bacterium]|nr:2,3-bisphosphoglycerate-independent phosphoglycerate mutase [Candidatus Paceibacterota bacterium]
MMKKQAVLIVLDGWGYREDTKNNSIASANTPFFDKLWNNFPHTTLDASGLAVGLPKGQMGNSEVGHTTIGAGSIIHTDLVRINKAIEDGVLCENKALKKLFSHVKENNSTLHLSGLLSPGGVHSHQEHLYAILKEAKRANVENVAIHVFTDGRDTPPQSAKEYLKELESVVAELGVGFIASLSGRFYAMDRDKNWDRIEKTKEAIFECKGNICKVSPSVEMEELYNQGINDEYIEPIVFEKDGKTYRIQDNDAVFFFNFRPDRARELTKKILDNTKDKNVCFASMTSYGLEFTCDVAFPDTNIEHTLARSISEAGLDQVHIAETEKFAHATYFLNGGREKPFKGETQIVIPSRKDVKTHDEAPEMRAGEIADTAITEIQKGIPFVFINFANPDMVGHTGNIEATIKAVETVDRELGRVIDSLEPGSVAFITSDHGNSEINIDENGDPHTAHTTNPVPAILTEKGAILRNGGGLSDIAPTILDILGIEKPKEMTGKSLTASY